MAPEQAMGKTAQLGPEADQFALATIGYEMLTGTVAFDGETLAEIVYRVVQETPPPIESLVPGVPAHSAAAIARAMAKDPADRFPDVESFVTAMAGPTVGHPEPRAVALAPTAMSLPPTAPALAAVTEPSRGRPTGVLVALAASLLLVGGGGLAFWLTPGFGGQSVDPVDPVDPVDGVSVGVPVAPGTGERPTDPPPATADGTIPGEPSESEGVDSGGSEGEPPATVEPPTMVQPPTMAEEAASAPTAMTAMREPGGMAVSAETQAHLAEAEAALGRGDGRAALNAAQRAFRDDRSAQARAMMARAYCQLRDLGGANAMARALPRGARRRVVAYCGTVGLTLADN